MKIMIVTAVVFVKLIDFQAFQMKEKIVKEKKVVSITMPNEIEIETWRLLFLVFLHSQLLQLSLSGIGKRDLWNIKGGFFWSINRFEISISLDFFGLAAVTTS